MNQMLVKALFIVLCLPFIITGVFGLCQDQNLDVAPCDCSNTHIQCGGPNINDNTLKRVIQLINENLAENKKHFLEISLISTNLTELKQDVFGELTFDSITLINNFKLESINTNAFTATNFRTKTITLSGLQRLNQTPRSFFDVLSKLVNLEHISMDHYVNITEIPANAFRPINGHQNHLKTIDFHRSNFVEIGTRAFYFLNSLEKINFYRSGWLYISENAFEFENKSNHRLEIELPGSLKPDSFNFNSLRSIKRPTTIKLTSYQAPIQFGYLEERIFLPFIFDDSQNLLQFHIEIDCNDCRNAWLKEYSSIINSKWTCYSHSDIRFDDPSTFSHCRV